MELSQKNTLGWSWGWDRGRGWEWGWEMELAFESELPMAVVTMKSREQLLLQMANADSFVRYQIFLSDSFIITQIRPRLN